MERDNEHSFGGEAVEVGYFNAFEDLKKLYLNIGESPEEFFSVEKEFVNRLLKVGIVNLDELCDKKLDDFEVTLFSRFYFNHNVGIQEYYNSISQSEEALALFVFAEVMPKILQFTKGFGPPKEPSYRGKDGFSTDQFSAQIEYFLRNTFVMSMKARKLFDNLTDEQVAHIWIRVVYYIAFVKGGKIYEIITGGLSVAGFMEESWNERIGRFDAMYKAVSEEIGGDDTFYMAMRERLIYLDDEEKKQITDLELQLKFLIPLVVAEYRGSKFLPDTYVRVLNPCVQRTPFLQMDLLDNAFQILISADNLPEADRDRNLNKALYIVMELASLEIGKENMARVLFMLERINGLYPVEMADFFDEKRMKCIREGHYVEKVCAGLAFSVDDKCVDYGVAADVFFPTQVILENPDIVDQFIDLLEKPKINTFYQTCRVLAKIMLRDDGEWILRKVSEKVFAEKEGIVQGTRLVIVKSLLDSLETPRERAKLQTFILAGERAKKLATVDEQEQMLRLLGISKAVINEWYPLESLYEKEDEELAKLDSISSSVRENQKLYDYIVQNRSTNISSGGNKIGKTQLDSGLEANVKETIIKRNKDSRKYPHSLAANICLRFHSGKSSYFRLSKNGAIFLRVFEDGQLKREYNMQEFQAMYGLSKESSDEIVYFIFSKLKAVFVRKTTVDLGKEKYGKGEAGGKFDVGKVLIREIEATVDSDIEIPFTKVREECRHVLDLTDQPESLMEVKDLSDDRKRKKRETARITKGIKVNKALAKRFLHFCKESPMAVQELPEEFEDLVVYQLVKIGSEYFYEAVPIERLFADVKSGTVVWKDYYVRNVRAFTQSLPYMKVVNANPLSTDEADSVNRFCEEGLVEKGDTRCIPYGVVKKCRQDDTTDLKMSLFAASGESYGLNLSPKERMLSFEVDLNERNKALYEAIKSKTMEEIEYDIRTVMISRINKNLRLIRLKHRRLDLSGSDYRRNEHIIRKIQIRLIRMYQYYAKQEVKRRLELQENTVAVNAEESYEGVYSKVRFPQVFPFDQTFNQGQFASLADIEKEVMDKKIVK